MPGRHNNKSVAKNMARMKPESTQGLEHNMPGKLQKKTKTSHNKSSEADPDDLGSGEVGKSIRNLSQENARNI